MPGSGDGCRALDNFWVADRPLIRLRSAHGDTHDKFQPLNAKLLSDQPMLSPNVIIDSDVGKFYPIERSRSIMGRAREPIPDLICNDDIILIGIDGSSRPDVGLFDNLAGTRVPSQDGYRIVLLRG